MTFRFFGGKGGVGKTTCAAAAALNAAEAGRRVLVVSTDPAHSLGDALAVRLTGEPASIPTRRGTLLAAELDIRSALASWMEAHREELRSIAERGTYLDAADVDRLLGLSLPGADELIGLLELGRLARETACDEVVVDTAPTAHTLRLLAMPGALRRFAGVLDRLQGRHRLMAERFGGSYRTDASDELVVTLEAEGRGFEELLRDPERTDFTWVTLPEALSVAESRDAVAALDAAGLRVREILVNRVAPPDADPARLRDQATAIEEIREAFGDRTLLFVPEIDREPRGKVALRRLEPHPLAPSPGGRGGTQEKRRKSAAKGKASLRWLPPTLRLLLFGGKGGVGKTTCAAAAALALAERRPEARLLLLSTDPAHSLADVLDVPLGDDERPVPGAPPSLRVRELDASRAFERWRDRHGETAGEALTVFTPEGGAAGDLLELTPPGLDELVAVSTLLDAVFGEDGAPAYDLVVVDTAPTGHALRLLEMPELALSWDHTLLSVLLKYREAVRLGDLAAELVELSRSLKRLEALLRDPARTGFVAVTRAAELPLRETTRLLGSLRQLAIAVPAVVLNAVAPGAGIPEDLRSRLGCGGCAIMEAPAAFPPPRGVGGLTAWIRTWREAER